MAYAQAAIEKRILKLKATLPVERVKEIINEEINFFMDRKNRELINENQNRYEGSFDDFIERKYKIAMDPSFYEGDDFRAGASDAIQELYWAYKNFKEHGGTTGPINRGMSGDEWQEKYYGNKGNN